jgi:hypothetical protein
MTESEEQKIVIEYCALRRWKFWSTDQSMYSKNWGQLRKRKALGVRPGLPDLVVFVNYGGKVQMVFIEMKKVKGKNGGMNGSKIGTEQMEFSDLCENAGILHKFCHGHEDAIDFLNRIEDSL